MGWLRGDDDREARRQYYTYIEQARAGVDENIWLSLGANTGTGRCVSAREP